ncbi:oxidoreductase [Streptomyces sulfonofaciens]|uniref:Oxidoreductase n=1 Tax=Streptomyces sulfonofaciens TaxID=68272 RepID=A0A919KYJ8_9ACTN|nr:Gfo/Idh/MocA family oxidoreductase [Streptomyces sulfonofaciens]GHH76884.1 oxidoreductase [Streptomyces sulfonofaciens]
MTLGIGLIGATGIATRTMIAPSRHYWDAAVLAVAASDHERAAAYAHEHDIPHLHPGYQDVIDDPDVNLVYVSLHNSGHAPWAARAAAAGKAVVVEKPLCLTTEEHAGIIAAAGGTPVLEALPTLGHPWHAVVRDAVLSGRYGPLREVRSGFAFAVPHSTGYRLRPELGGGCFFDAAAYWLQALQDTVGLDGPGSPGYEGRSDFSGPAGVDTAFSATLHLPHGTTAHLDCSFGAQHRAEHTFVFAEASLRVRGVLLPTRGALPINIVTRTKDGRTTVTRTEAISYYQQQFARIRGLMHDESGPWGAELTASGPRIALMAAIHEHARQSATSRPAKEQRT